MDDRNMTQWRTMDGPAFTAWHDQLKIDMGFPKPGVNAATGQPVPAPIGVTTDYTTAVTVGSFDTRCVVMFADDDENLPGDPAADPSWFTDPSLQQLWVDADKWALVPAETQAAFKAYPDPQTCLGEPTDVVLDDIDYVVWAKPTITDDQLVALGVILPA